MSNKIIKRQNKTLIKKDDKVIKARKGNVKMLHYPAKNGCCETTILFSNKFKVQFADSNISDYEMDCDVCETGGPYSVGRGLQYQTPPDTKKGHFIEVVCDKCGKRFLLKPVLSVHYEVIADSDDNYIPLREMFERG